MAVKKDKEAPKNEFLEKVRNTSLRDLVKEDKEAQLKEKEEEKIGEEPKNEEPKEKPKEEVKEEPKEEEKPEIKPEELITKTAKEIATELRKIDKDKELSDVEKEARKDAVKAHWTGYDEKGNPTPKSYDEIVAEARRIAFEDFKEFYKEQKAQELEEFKKVQGEEEVKKKEQEKAYQTTVEQTQAKINEEMEELFASGKLKRPKDVNNLDLKNQADKEYKDLFDQAIKFNEDRRKEGKPMIDSIAKFYFMHYKPSGEQPAGEDAPIAGNTSGEPESEELDYMRDVHNKSWWEILRDGRRKMENLRRK